MSLSLERGHQQSEINKLKGSESEQPKPDLICFKIIVLNYWCLIFIAVPKRRLV